MPQINANLTLNTAQAQATFDQFVRSINSNRLGQPLGRISGDAAEFNKSMQAATARVTAFGLSAGAILQVKNAIVAAASATIEVDKQLIELNTFLGQSTSELDKFSKSLFQIAKNTAAPFSDAAGAAKEFARQGLSANEVLERTGAALTLARISGLGYQDSVQGITTAINSFGKEALKATEITNKLIAVDTRFAVSSADLNEAIRRVGSSAEESGVGIDSLIAAVTAAQQTTGRGGAVIGNALKTIFTRLQRPEVLTQLEQLGVAVRDQNGFLLDGIGILKNYSDATKNLSQSEKSRTAELIGGIYQINQLNALIKDLSNSNSVYANSLSISNSATDEAKKKNEELNKSLSSMLQGIKNTATEAASSLGSSFLRPLVEIGTSVSENLLKLVNPSGVGSELGTQMIKGFAGVFGEGLSKTALPLLGSLAGLLAVKMGGFGRTAFKELAKSSGNVFESKKELQIQERINDVVSRNPGLISQINAGKITQKQAEAQILDLILKQNQELRAQATLSQRTFTTVTQAAPRKKRFGMFADGYIPTATKMAEAAGAQAGGYAPGKVVKSPVGGVMNTAEDVKYVPGFAQPFINPPAGSKAGRAHRQNAISRTGVDPYMAKGYIPNFAKGININDKIQDYTGEILKKEKVIETRDSVKGLKPYVGKQVGLVRTGVGDATLVGYAKIGNPIKYETAEQFRADYPKHKVKEGSKYDFANSKYGVKYGFPLSEVTPTKNIKITSRGNVAREIPNFASGYIPNFAVGRVPKLGPIKDYPTDAQIMERFREGIAKGKHFANFYDRYEKTNPLKGSDRELFNKIYASQSYGTDDSAVFRAAIKIFKGVKSGETNFDSILRPLGLHKGRTTILNKILSGKELTTEKTGQYFKAISGDKNALAIDRNVINTALGRTMQKGESTSAAFRERLRNLIRKEAVDSSMDPRAIQASLYAGRSPNQSSFDDFEKGFDQLRSKGYVPNFANINAEKLILGGRGNNLLLTSPYDSLKTNLDPSSQVSGGIGYGLKFPDRSYASTARSSGVDAMQALHDYAKKQGGRAYFAPHVPAGAISKYGADDGGMNMRNIFFLQQLVSKNQKDFPRSFVSSVLSINPANASLKGTGSLYDEARNHLRRRGFSSKAIGKKFREGASGLHDEMVEKYADAGKNKYSISGIVSRVSDVGGSVIAPSSGHALYPKSTYADAQFSSAQGIDITHEIEKLTGVKVTGTTKQKYSPSGKPMNRPDPAGTSYQPTSSFLPYGVRFDKGDPISQMFGGLAEGYVPNFALGQKHLNPDGKRHSRKLARSSEEISAMSKAFKSLNLERKNNKISIFKSEYSHWSGKNQSIGLEKPYRGLSSRAKQIEILAAYAHEMGHSSQLSGLERLRGAHSEIFNKHYTSAGVGEGYDREFQLLQEQDAWKEGLRFIPRQFQSAYKTQANRFYKTYSPDGKPMFDAFGAPGYASGYVPNFAGFNLSTIRFLTKASAKMSGSVLSPKTLIKFATGKGKVEDLVNPFIDFLKKPADVINTPQDLEDAKSIVNLIFKNNQAREMAATRLAPMINESSFSVKSQEEAISAGIKNQELSYGGRPIRDYRDFLRYRVLGGQKEYQEYVGKENDRLDPADLSTKEISTLIKNKDGSYRFNPKSFSGQRELSEIRRSATALFATPEKIAESRPLMDAREAQKKYKARKLGPEDNVPGPNPFLGYTYKLGRFIGNVFKTKKTEKTDGREAVGYNDEWDVKLHRGERDVMENFLKNTEGISDLEERKHVANRYIDRDLSDGSYAGDINSLIVKELLSSIPGARPVLLKGVTRVPKGESIFAEGYVPNFAGAGLGSPLLKAYRSTLKTLKSGNVVLADRKQIEEEYGNADGLEGYYIPARSNSINAGSIVLNEEELNNNPMRTARVMTHEGSHKFFDLFDEATVNKFYNDREAQRQIGFGPAGLVAKGNVKIPTLLKDRLATASMGFANRASSEVKNSFQSYQRVAALPEAYNKADYLEEMIADGSLANEKDRKVLSEYLGLSPEKLAKFDKLWRRGYRYSVNAVYRDPKLRGIHPSPRLANYPTVAEPRGTPLTPSASLASGYVPNFAGAGLGSSLLRSVRSTLEMLKSGNVTVTDSKQLESIYGKRHGRPYGSVRGLYDGQLDEIILNKTVGTDSEFGTARLMAHEATHRVFGRLDRENNKKLSFEEQFLMATGQAENAGLRPPVRKKLADASIAFEDTASADVKNYFPSYGRVVSNPEFYDKSNYLEEMLADGSLDTIKGRQMLSGHLGLSVEKLTKVHRLYQKLFRASVLGVSKKKSLRNLSYREPEVYDPAGDANVPLLSSGYIPNFSGLSDAVSREKTMSGLPASQIMAHFDRGGNPVAVTNKRDEPNGLKDVPNFAIPRPLLRFLSTRSRGLTNPVSGGSELFAGNLVTALLNALAENEKVSPDFAASASAGIPAGIGIANVLRALTSKRGTPGQKVLAGLTGAGQIGFGALTGYSAKTDLEKRINEKRYSEALDRSKTAFQNLTENTAELADTFAKLEAAYRDPQADPRTITKLAKKQQELLNKVSLKNPDLGVKLASEPDLGKKQTIIEDSAREAQRQESIRQASLKFSAQGKISGKDASAKISDFFSEIINAGNAEVLNQDLSQAKPSDFGDILKKGGLNVAEFSQIFQTDELKKAFIDGLKATQKLNEISQQQASEIRELSKPLTDKKQKIDDAREVRLAISGVLKEQLPELASFASGFSKRAGISASSNAALAITRSETSVAFNNTLQAQLADPKFSAGLPANVKNRLLGIESPSKETAKELESLKTLPGLSKEQVVALDKLIDFNNQQNRKLENANKIASETKNIQLKFLALQEKLAFGGDIRSSIDPEARREAMGSAIRGPLTYQLGGLLGSKRTQVAGATDFLTDTIKKYPGLLQTKDGKEPADIQGVKRELAGLNAMDMQRDLLKRAGMAEMMGLGQTGSMLRSKAFDQNYLLESAGLKTNALFGSPEVPEEVKKAMEEYEKFNVKGVREFKGEEQQLKGLEDLLAPVKQKITESLQTEGKTLAEAFIASLNKTFGQNGIKTDLVNITTNATVDKDAANKNVENAAKAWNGQGAMPTGYSSNANGLTKYSSSIADAVKREKTALASRGIMGVPNFAMAGINLERSPDLMTPSNPAGFAITNSIDEKNGLRSLGMRSSGYVPNFALKDVQKVAEGIKDATKGYKELEEDHALKGVAAAVKGIASLGAPILESFQYAKKKAPGLAGIDSLMDSANLFSEENYLGTSAKVAEGAASLGSIFEKTSSGFQMGLKATASANVGSLGQYGGKLSGAASAAGLIAEIATSKNNAIAEDASDIIFGKKTDGKTNALGAGLNVASLGLTAASGPFGLGVATATLGYRTGNVIENKLGIGDKLGEAYAGGAASAIARNADKATVGLSSKEASASGLAEMRKAQLMQQADLLNKAAGYPEVNRSAILARSKNAEDRKRESQNLIAGSAGAFIPNFALFGDKVAAAGLAAAQSDKLYVYDKGTEGFHKVSSSGGIDYKTSLDYKSLPKGAKTISTELYASAKDPVENTQKRGSNILGIKDPKVSKLNELQISTIPKSQLLDPVLEKLSGAGRLSQADNLTPENLRDEVDKLTGGKRSLIKTAFGPKNYGGYGVFGRNTDLGLSDYEEIIKRYKSGADSGFFAQTAVKGPYYGETRVHVAVDANGRVKLVKGATMNKIGTGADSLSKEYINDLMAENPGTTRKQMEEVARANKKASEAIAVRSAREYVKKFGIKNTIFGVDTIATTLESAQEAGATAKAFNAHNGRKLGAIVIEMNPTDVAGSSGYMKGSAVQGLVNSVLGIENKPQGNAGNVLMGTQTPQASPRVTLPDEIPSGAGFNRERYLRWLRGQQRMAERRASQDRIPDESPAQSTPRANRGLPPAPRPTGPGSNLIGTPQQSMPAEFAPRALPPLPRPTGPGSNLIGTQQPSMPAGFAPRGGEAPPIPGGTGGGLPPRDARGRFTARGGGGAPTGGSGGPPPSNSYFGSMAFGSGGSGGGNPPAGSSTILNKLKGAGATGLKGLGLLFGAMQAKESYDQAKEGNYGKSTLAGLSSAASFAGLSKTAGKIAGPAGVALGALTDLESDLTLAKDVKDIFGRRKRTYSVGPDGKTKEDVEPIGAGDIIGTAIGAITAAPVTAAILGYRTGNIIENKYRVGERLGDFASAVASGGRSLGLTSGPIRGMKSKEAYDSDQILTRKMELVKEINKYNRAAGNPEISVGENILKAKKAQKRKDEADISALQEKLDKENKAARAGITARATAAGAAETGILNKKSTEEEEARRTKLRRSFIESFEKNGGADKFQTTKEKVEYFLNLERQLNQGTDPNGFGTFKPTDFKDPEFAKSFDIYKRSKETEAAREAKRVFPKPSEEFKNRPPQQSFPDDVLREAVRTGRSAETVMQDREDEKIKRGLIPPIPLPSQTEIRNRPDPFARDVLLEAARRRVPAEKIIQEREEAKKDPLPLLPPALMGEIAIAGKSGSLIPGPLPSKIQGGEGFDPNKPDSYPADVVAEAIRTGRKPEQVIKDREQGIQATDVPGGYSKGIVEEAMNRRGLTPVPQAPLPPQPKARDDSSDPFPRDVLLEATRRGVSAERVMQDRAGLGGGFMTGDEANVRRGAMTQGMTLPEINQQEARETGLQNFPKDVLEEAMRRRVTAEQVMRERAGGAVPNFAAMSNSMMSSGDVYSRMRATSARSSMSGYSGGHVPNFAAEDFTNAISEAMKNGITSAFPNGGSSSSVSNSNVINIDGRTSIQNASDDAMQGIIGILFDKFPELKKLGPSALNFKR